METRGEESFGLIDDDGLLYSPTSVNVELNSIYSPSDKLPNSEDGHLWDHVDTEVCNKVFAELQSKVGVDPEDCFSFIDVKVPRKYTPLRTYLSPINVKKYAIPTKGIGRQHDFSQHVIEAASKHPEVVQLMSTYADFGLRRLDFSKVEAAETVVYRLNSMFSLLSSDETNIYLIMRSLYPRKSEEEITQEAARLGAIQSEHALKLKFHINSELLTKLK
jgi:hypothetical protein